MFIQENFFNLPFQIAYVIDPVQNIRGFFQWKNGRIEKLKGYYIYDDIGKPIKIDQVSKNGRENSSKDTLNSTKALKILVALLCITTTALSVFAVSLRCMYNRQLSTQKNTDFNARARTNN